MKLCKSYSIQFEVLLTVHHSIQLFHQPTLMHNFLYSLTICLLHYYPRHVSSINIPIFRRKNCIHTASGIFALCKRLPSTLVESGPLSTTAVTTDLGHPYWIHNIPTHDMHQWLLLQFLVLLMMDAESVRNM